MVRLVAARLSPLKEYRAPIFRTPDDVTSRQEFQPVWLRLISIVLLLMISLYGYQATQPWTDIYYVTYDD